MKRMNSFAILAVACGLALAAFAIASAHAGVPVLVPPELLVYGAMAVQTSYSTEMADGTPGMAANMTGKETDTRICETAAGIGFGLACGQGSDDKGAVLGGALANFVGISVRDVTLVRSAGQDVDEYQQYENMAVATKGDWWVQTSVDVAVTDPVHYNATTGLFAISGGSGPIVGARWMKAHASGRAIVRLSGHLPVP